MTIRRYESADCKAMAELFCETVHSVNDGDYSPQQLDAWAPGLPDLEAWDRSFREHLTLVAVEDGVVVGFGDMDGDGYLDRLYVHKDRQGRGIASAICDRLEGAVKAERFTTHASVTARDFFERRGYAAVKEQQVERRGVLLTNFVMEKPAGRAVEIVRAEPGTRLWAGLIEYARACPWAAGGHLAGLMEAGAFTDWESVFAAVEAGEPVGFCTFLKTDYYPENRYSPWISTIFVDEARRGRGICGRLIEAAVEYAGGRGFRRVYIPSDIAGLYERYGFRKIDELRNYGGDVDMVFEREIC